MDVFRQTFKEQPIAVVGGSWMVVVAGTLYMVQRKQIPLQLKIIQARIVAQGALLAGCGIAAIMSFVTTAPAKRPEIERYTMKPPAPLLPVIAEAAKELS